MSWRLVLIAWPATLLIACESPALVDENEAASTPEMPALARVSSPSKALRRVPVSIGDSVRVVPDAITEEWGVAGLTGEVIGTTSGTVNGSSDPNTVTGVTLTLTIEGRAQVYSFSRNLVELTSLEPDSIISMGERSWILTEDGEWEEVRGDR